MAKNLINNNVLVTNLPFPSGGECFQSICPELLFRSFELKGKSIT